MKFRRTSFSAVKYAAYRMTYPPSLFRTVLDYHQGPKKLCLDLGAGHGLISRQLSPEFSRVFCTDPSAGMIEQAISSTSEKNIDFRVASTEDLSWMDDNSVDMVVSGQAAHWFDYEKAWPQIARKVRKGGTLAFWGYIDNVFVDNPKASQILDHYCYGPGKDLMGMYWEQPGRNKLRDLYRDITPPKQDWEQVTRFEYVPGTKGADSGTLGKKLMYKRMKLGDMEGYARTFSAYNGWQRSHPEIKSKAQGGEGDVVDEMFEKMLEAEEEWAKMGENWRDIEVESEWGSVILLARRS